MTFLHVGRPCREFFSEIKIVIYFRNLSFSRLPSYIVTDIYTVYKNRVGWELDRK